MATHPDTRRLLREASTLSWIPFSWRRTTLLAALQQAALTGAWSSATLRHMPAASSPGPDEPHQPHESGIAELTLHQRDMAEGRGAADATVIPYLVGELRAIARGYLRARAPAPGLQPSALVNETYLKLFGGRPLEIADRVHFFALAARAMRQVLVDRARRRNSLERGGDRAAVSVSMQAAGLAAVDVDVLDLNSALEEMAALDERQAAVVELRYFGGLAVSEVAEVLEISTTTVEREWRAARAWLGRRLKNGDDR